MGIAFNADEILEIAERIERNGGRFYNKAAANLGDNEDARKMLSGLASMEAEHEKTFRQMRERLTPEERQTNYYDPDSEGSLYLKAIADGNVFDYRKDPSDMLKGDETVSDVISIAIGLEKDSVVFYLGIREMVPADRGQARIDEIIKEEMKHITILSKHLVSIKA